MSTRLEDALRRLIPFLLLAYPADFRRRFGHDLTTTYIDRFDAAHAKGGPWSVARFLAIATVHSLRDGFLERLTAARRGRLATGTAGLGMWLTDLRLAMRALFRQPAFLAITVSTLGLGIGASTTMFSVVDSVLLRPLPYDRAEELVAIGFRIPEFEGLTPVAWRIAQTFEDRAESVTHVATVRSYEADVEPDAEFPQATRLWAASVSSGFFPALAVYPFIGRTFTSAEDLAPNARVLILSHDAWTRRWGADSVLSAGRSWSMVSRTKSSGSCPRVSWLRRVCG